MEVYARVRRAVQVDGMSIRQAAQEFGVCRKTIRRMLQFSLPPGYRRKRPVQRPKLGPWLGIIDQILLEDESQPRKQRNRWGLNSVGGNAVNAIVQSSSKCLDDTGRSLVSGQPTQQWVYDAGGLNQQWNQVATGSFYKFVNVLSGLVLTERADDVVIQATEVGSDAALWAVIPVVVSTTPGYADGEAPSGSINGTNLVLTLAYVPVAFPILARNGVVLGPSDFCLSGNQITFKSAPNSGDALIAWYRH